MREERMIRHTQPGEMVAMATQQVENPQDHIEQCPACKQTYTFLTQFVRTLEDPGSPLPTDCPGTDREIANFIAQFLRQNLPREEMTLFFAHINGCYQCFELLSRHWSFYMAAVKSSSSASSREVQDGKI